MKTARAAPMKRVVARSAKRTAGRSAPPILTLLRQSRSGLPPTARRIRDYIVTYAEDVIRMSITDLAEQTRSSEGSVVGLCQRFGIKGFQELKILLARRRVLVHEALPEIGTASHYYPCCLNSLPCSLFQSRCLIVSRLSWAFLPRASASSTFARPRELK